MVNRFIFVFFCHICLLPNVSMKSQRDMLYQQLIRQDTLVTHDHMIGNLPFFFAFMYANIIL
jgi:hypothetical protein